MLPRERSVSKARKSINDARLVAFLRAAGSPETGILAVKLILDHLNAGQSLDEIFYDGKEFGFDLDVKKQPDGSFVIQFGCVAGELAGDGGSWVVKFNEKDEVVGLEGTERWMS